MKANNRTRMTVSVIVPAYNREKFIKAAIDSALNQTRVPDEILVVDDGSTDDTPRILEEYGPPVRVIRQVNRGRSVARNVGLRHATGDAVIFLDSDDLLMPRNIEQCIGVLEDQPSVDVVYTDALFVDENLNKIASQREIQPGRPASGMVLGELARRCFLTISSMVRRSSLGDITFEEGRECGEDYDFWRKVAANCRFHYVDEPLMRYRCHEGMTVTSRRPEILAAELEVQRRIMAMPEFIKLSRPVKARAYCHHGAKNAISGRIGAARKAFWRAVCTSPGCLTAHVLLGLSLLGRRPLQYAVLKRRRLIGNQRDAEAGEQAIAEQRRAPSSMAPVATPPVIPAAAPVASAPAREPALAASSQELA